MYSYPGKMLANAKKSKAAHILPHKYDFSVADAAEVKFES